MMEAAKMIRIALVDDHAMVREGLRAFLQLANDITIVAEAGTGAEAIELADTEELDVILMDLVMPGAVDGVRATREISKRHPQIRIIALTSFQEKDRMLGVIEAGALSFLQKDVSPEDLLSTIRQAAAGRTVLEPAALLALKDSRSGELSGESPGESPMRGGVAAESGSSLGWMEPLTPREQEVLEAMAQGMSNKEVSAALGISEKTVKVHVSHILSKLGVYDRTQAILAASKRGLIQI
jgi:two-component system, NarL family, response regulator LiaR